MKEQCLEHSERLAGLEEWKKSTEQLLQEVKNDVKNLNRNLWLATGVILTIQAILKFPNIAKAFINLN